MSSRGFRFLYDRDLIRTKAVLRPARVPGWGGTLPELCKFHQGHVHFICSVSRASDLIACIISSPALAFHSHHMFCLGAWLLGFSRQQC